MAFFWLFTKLPHAVCFNKIVKRLQYKKIASIKNYKTETRKPLITPLGNHKNTMTTAVEKTKPSQSPATSSDVVFIVTSRCSPQLFGSRLKKL